ncbi:MAG TPA: hypothetical protein VM008_20940 [Phycisphaerae bacterium]|nr:hypothetical protein [Phycisphaerae bacterium]
MTSNVKKIDQAFYTAESGAQRVAWYCKHGKMGSITSPLTGSVGSYAYSTSWTTVSGSTIRITSIGSLGSVAYTCYQTAAPPGPGAAVMASSGDFNNKNIDVTGNVATGGDYTNGGSGSLTGNLTYSGTASNTGSVTGSVTKGTFTAVDMSAMGTTLINAAGRTYNGNQSNIVIDFTTVSGTNKVVYINGNLSNPTFVGSGTLYVSGTASLGSFGTASAPVNIVAAGAVTLSNNTMYGSLYAASSLTTGHFDMTGLIYVAGTFSRSNSGKSSITMTTAPWFDPRGSGGGGGTTTSLANFAGPLP